MWENVRFSMNSTMPLFFVMLLGYVLYQKKFLSDAFVAGANKFVFYVALPVQLFRDLAATDVRAAFDGAYVLFCFVVTLVSILGIWALAKLFLPDKRLVGEFVQVCYRSSAAILGTAFLQSIYGTAEMSSMMILGSVPLYNVEGTAGLVPLFLDKASRQPVDYIHIPNLPKCDGAIYVVGDSMYPLLKSGDIVLYKQLNDINDIFWGDMYLLSIDIDGEEYITVKYIQKSDKEGCVRLVSQNVHHADKDVEISRIRALAFVKASIRMNSIR